MADLRYKVAVDTKGAQDSLNSLRGTIAGVAGTLAGAFSLKAITDIASRFQDLRTTLGILFKDVEQGAKAFEQIKTFATQSIFTVEDLTASVIKLKAAGLDPTIDQLRLFADVASVSADSVGALQAITDLYARTSAGGLGLEELNRLADRGIPVFTILADKIGISRLEISELGKTSEGAQIILKALEEGLAETFGGSSAARTNNLSQAFSNLEDAIGNAADQIGQGGFNDSLAEAVRNISGFIDKNAELMTSIGQGLGVAIKFIADNIKYLIALLGGMFAAWSVGKIVAIISALNTLRKSIVGVSTATAILQGVTGVGLVKVIAGVAAAAGVVATIESMTDDASDNIEKLQTDIEKLSKSTDGIPQGPLTAPDAPAGPNYTKMLEDLKTKQDAVTKSSIDYFKTYQQGVEDLQLTINQETELLKLTEDKANIQRELNSFEKRYYDTIRPLQQQLTELKQKDTDKAKVQAEEIEKQIGLVTKLYNESVSGLEAQLKLREKIRKEQEQELALIDVINSRRDFFADMDEKIRDANTQLEKLNLSKFEGEVLDIKEQIGDELVEAIRKVKEKWEDGLITTDAYIAEIKTLEDNATKTFEKLKDIAEQQRETQRSFAYGWKNAFDEYLDNATNAAKQAEKIFNKATSSMEDALVNFAKTGKFQFRDLVADILETILRSQIQQLIGNIFSLGGSSGGGSTLGKIFSGFFANGGMIPAGTFGVTGERGPELVAGPATVTPLSGLGGSNVTYNINAVDASSFKQMVARDPQFIHAVATQGARSVPGRR